MAEAEEREVRAKKLVAVRFWEDDYSLFKKICHEERTTPTAVLNRFVREYPQKKKEEK